jgi:hypothetical protein
VPTILQMYRLTCAYRGLLKYQTQEELARLLLHVGLCDMEKGRYATPHERLSAAYNFCMKHRSPEDELIIDSLDNLGTVCAKSGKWKEATSIHGTTFGFRQKLYGAADIRSFGNG